MIARIFGPIDCKHIYSVSDLRLHPHEVLIIIKIASLFIPFSTKIASILGPNRFLIASCNLQPYEVLPYNCGPVEWYQ